MNHKDTKDTKKTSDDLSYQIIGAAIEVHKALGPGLLESAYELCLCRELSLRNVPFARQVPVPLEYKGVRLECGYQMDLLVGDLVVVELKAVDEIAPVHRAQIISYLRLTNLWLGLLVNFHVPILTDGGIERFVN